tara:strand:+ start:12656 stop:13093 length:438 start_codon:yes stop_codon:yes gene_type:complete
MNSILPDVVPDPGSSCSYVLVVDDDQAVLAMTKAILDSVGFTAIGATSGELGLQYYQQGVANQTPFLLVLLDLTLPGGMSGLETLDAIREFDPKARVIATSGYFDDTAVVAQGAKQRGFVGVLPKPYTAERLMKLVQWGVERNAA